MSIFFVLAITTTIYSFTSGREINATGNKYSLFKDSSEFLFLKWAQANNGKWMPYCIRLSFENGKRLGILNNLASRIKVVNEAKAYYKNLLKRRLRLSDSLTSAYLDSMYIRKYKAVKESLKYRKTMDSLYAVYRKISSGKNKELNGYTLGSSTKYFTETIVPKIFVELRKRGLGIYDVVPTGCIPFALTDWFDNHYSRPGLQYYGVVFYICGRNYNPSGYYDEEVRNDPLRYNLQQFIRRFMMHSLGFYTVYISPEEFVPKPLNCSQIRDSILSDISDYYKASKAANHSDFLTDRDLFQSESDIYFTDYQLTPEDKKLWNKIDSEDRYADSIMQHP
ncbi:hypothetical protein [Arachidicoccus ginsenosidimutans]|uniref:hypothetical protein n=1 Tax=Arachidicoccus sp. BS20 TaxID=1850526 RepID=UPI001E3909E8|nr:hypothetical protein [Arachidicoccus sp. BS20]